MVPASSGATSVFQRFTLLLVVSLAFLAVGAAMPVRGAGLEAAAAAEAKKNWLAQVLPAVVSISTVKFVDDKPGQVPPRRINGFGSGFIVDPNGVVVTNRHVIEGATEVRVVLADGTSLPAKSLYVGAQIDLAVLKVNAGRKLPALKFANSDALEIGDPVAAIGNPLMLGGSVSAGIVSALNRDLMSSAYDDFIQTDAAINHGNSGGPLVDMRGQVVGMNTAIYSPTADSGSIGIGFAAPSNDVAFVVDQVLRNGHVRAGWVGANAQTLTEQIAQAVKLDQAHGAILTGVSRKSPAGKAGLEEGDVILKLGDRPVLDSRALARMVAESTPGSVLPVTLWRDGKEMTLPITIAEWQDHPMREVGGERDDVVPVRPDTVDYGLRFGAINEDARRRLKLDPGQKGAVVTDVGLNSPAADSGFRAGDVVLRVQMQAVSGPDDAKRQLDDAVRARTPVIIVLVQRADGLRWLPLSGTFKEG